MVYHSDILSTFDYLGTALSETLHCQNFVILLKFFTTCIYALFNTILYLCEYSSIVLLKLILQWYYYKQFQL